MVPKAKLTGKTGWPPALFGLLLAMLLSALAVQPAHADALERFLKKVTPADLYPDADAFGGPAGSPGIVPIMKQGREVAFAFLNSDFVNAAGYLGKPIHVVIGIDKDARISGLRLVDHKEPIVLVGIPERKIRAVVDGYVGFDVAEFARGEQADREVDIVSGATVTIMVIDDSIVRVAIKVARRLELGGLRPEAAPAGPRWQVDDSAVGADDWAGLLGEGSVRRLTISLAEINRAFADSGDAIAAARPEKGDSQDTFIDLHAAVVSIPALGRALLGEAEYANLTSVLAPGRSAILVAARGRYSFKGSGYVRGGIFDGFPVIQGDESYRFRDRDHKRLGAVMAAGAPDLKEIDLFYIPEDRAFDPALPWRLELLAQRATGPTKKAYLTFDLGYWPPETYLKRVAGGEAPAVEAAMAPLWQRLWHDKSVEAAILTVALLLLTVIFFVQDWLTKRPKLTDRIRTGFLIFTFAGLGLYANAQLSVVNVMTFFNSLVTGFSWDYFLIEPLIFILWCSVAASLLFWGRGPFCGGLCPFGALQELLSKFAKAVKIPQIKVHWWLHQRLWPIKYMIFLLLFGVSFYSLAWAEQLAEVEPFKTSIVLKFPREWPYVLFAVGMLSAGLFIERFYCRYFCPLGAALAIPGRLRMFDWLLRYRECGNPCQRCGNDCMVGAIHPEGHINPNECFSCLHCQTLYHDDRRCPVMIQRRLKRERREALASKSLAGDSTAKPKRKTLELVDFLPD